MVSILGGGLSGLTAAYYLSKLNVSPVILYESTKHLGGWIRSECNKQENYIFESGPRTIRPKGPAAPITLELIEELELEKQINPIFPTHPAAKKRMIYAKNQLHVLPSSFSELFVKKSPFSKPLIVSLFGDLKAPVLRKKIDDESIYDFVERRFGTEIAQYAISSMICGICAGDAKEISVRFLMNDIFEKEQEFGSVLKGIVLGKILGKQKPKNMHIKSAESCNLAKKAKQENWSIYSLKNGLEILPQTLAKKLDNIGVKLETETTCEKIDFDKQKVVINVNGIDKLTDYLISSIPSYKLASLIEHQHPDLSNMLKSIPYVNVAVVNLQFDRPNLLKEEAFGFLVPPIEKLPILGIIFDSCCFDMNGNTVLTVMMGGKWFQEYFGDNPTEKFLLDTALKYVDEILKITMKPKNSKVNILQKCIPQYTIGHKKRVENIREYIEKNHLPLSVCGAAYDGVGVNDVILSAKSSVHSLRGL